MRATALAFLLLGTVTTSHAQISGTISDAETGAPLAGATVLVLETDSGTTADASGRFSLDSNRSELTLLVSYVGFAEQTRILRPESGAARADFRLVPQEGVLEEILIEQASMTGGLLGIKGHPGSAHLVTARGLATFETTDIHRALRTVPGVSIQEEDGYGLRPNIGLRGTGSERSSKITVMEDGILIAPAPYAASSAYYFPTTGRMSGIEVVKGSSQIKYGPFTTGGAINLLSTPIPQQTSGHLTLLAGDDANRLVHVHAGTSRERIAFLLETHRQQTDGFKQLDSGGSTGFEKSDVLAKLRFSSRASARVQQSLLFKASFTDELSDETYLGLTPGDFGLNPLRRYSGSQQDEMKTDQRQLLVRHRIQPIAGLNVITTAYTTRFNRNWYKLDKVTAGGEKVGIASLLADPIGNSAQYAVLTGDDASGLLSVKANNRAYRTMGLQTETTVVLGAHRVEAGARMHYDEMDRFQWVDDYSLEGTAMSLFREGTPGTESNRIESANAVAGWVQGSLAMGSLTFRPGLRFESVVQRREDFGKADPERTGASVTTRRNATSTLLPGLGMTWEASPYLTAFAGLHRGFAPGGTTEGARPEESLNYELGTRYGRGAIGFEAVLFASDYTNLLGSDLAAAGGTGSTDLFNGGAALVQGLEFSGTYNLGRLTDWRASVPVTVAYTRTKGSFLSDFESSFDPWGTVRVGDHLPYLAENQLNTTVAWEQDRVNVALSAFWVGQMRTRAGSGSPNADERIDSHLTLDLSVDVELRYGVSAFAVMKNLTDEVYVAARRPAGLRPGLPRSLMAGLRADF
ncbi:MAG: TonB-dependent receptor [Rhodothermales bacterium]|nr:TonB-dependent receptor [Rhodothermales bacterium]MBO6778981.1 TonB-dependent receptor [Rhodothermales bacterium]